MSNLFDLTLDQIHGIGKSHLAKNPRQTKMNKFKNCFICCLGAFAYGYSMEDYDALVRCAEKASSWQPPQYDPHDGWLYLVNIYKNVLYRIYDRGSENFFIMPNKIVSLFYNATGIHLKTVSSDQDIDDNANIMIAEINDKMEMTPTTLSLLLTS